MTGSAGVLIVPQLAEALAGRVEMLNLWPFSQGEIERIRERFIDASFSDRFLADAGTPVSSGSLPDFDARGCVNYGV